jgi:uncharacterized protein (TIGR00730 family)
MTAGDGVAEGDSAEPNEAPARSPDKLPWQSPKDASDDCEALERVLSTMADPSYRPADRDFDFLQSDETRAARLHLDYLKTELGLAAHGVGHTVVVFGSARLPEPRAAARELAAAAERLAAAPDDAGLQRAHRIAERVAAKSRYYETARDFAALIGRSAERPHGERIAIMTGGGPGLMEAANRGAFRSGAVSIGLNIGLPHEQYPNPYISKGLCFQFHYFAMRKLHLLHRARALVAFPGGFGTLDELFETLTLIQTEKIAPLPVVLVGREFWARAVDFGFLVDEGVISPRDVELFEVVETAEEIHTQISAWHAARGSAIFD